MSLVVDADSLTTTLLPLSGYYGSPSTGGDEASSIVHRLSSRIHTCRRTLSLSLSHAHTHTHARTHTHTHIDTSTPISTQTRTCARTCIDVLAQGDRVLPHVHACEDTHTHTRVHARAHTTQRDIDIDAHTHTIPRLAHS